MVDNKKRMMFALDEDYYYMTLKILVILNELGCKKNNFIDYRKFLFLIEFMKSNKDIELYRKCISRSDSITLFDRERLINIYYKSNLNDSAIKKVLFFLEKKGIIEINKNIKYKCFDIKLVRNDIISKVLDDEILTDDVYMVRTIKNLYPRIRSVKYDTFVKYIFGDSEVVKWEV